MARPLRVSPALLLSRSLTWLPHCSHAELYECAGPAFRTTTVFGRTRVREGAAPSLEMGVVTDSSDGREGYNASAFIHIRD